MGKLPEIKHILSYLILSASSLLFSLNTNPKYFNISTYFKYSSPIATVGQYNLKRRGLNTIHTDFSGLYINHL